jgi:hypothetical protein
MRLKVLRTTQNSSDSARAELAALNVDGRAHSLLGDLVDVQLG